MRKLLIVTAGAAAMLAAAGPAAARNSPPNNQGNDSTVPQQRARDGNAGERQICVNERLSDSRMRRRICHTAREWQDLQAGDSN